MAGLESAFYQKYIDFILPKVHIGSIIIQVNRLYFTHRLRVTQIIVTAFYPKYIDCMIFDFTYL